MFFSSRFFRQNSYVEYIEQDFLVKVYSATGYVTFVVPSYASLRFWGQSTWSRMGANHNVIVSGQPVVQVPDASR